MGATLPTCKQAEFRHVPATMIVDIERDDATIGVLRGRQATAWVVEKHLPRFVEGAKLADFERIRDQMYLSTIFLGDSTTWRCGIRA